MSRQFVIHEHSGHGPLHYDLMLSADDALATWRLAEPPFAAEAGRGVPAARLPDHRAAYLAYEGPVSGGRGSVRMLDGGTYDLLSLAGDAWEVEFHGRRLAGRWRIARAGDAEWTVERLSAPTP
jgi:hypothetical protein